MKLEGALALRDNQPVGGYCPIERTMAVVGTRSAMLVLREAFYGASRFEEFAARADLTDGTTSARLRDLVEAGILEKRPYQEPGQRRRHEYALTPAGEDLMPALFALLQWANRHDPPPFLTGSLPEVEGGVELEDLVRFVRHPVRAFLRGRLEVTVAEYDNEVEDALPVELDGLGRWNVGERMLHDRRLPLISFTGSTRIGRHVAGTVAERFGRTILELGGNNAIIVAEDANLDLATRAILFGAVGTAGQRCTSICNTQPGGCGRAAFQGDDVNDQPAHRRHQFGYAGHAHALRRAAAPRRAAPHHAAAGRVASVPHRASA